MVSVWYFLFLTILTVSNVYGQSSNPNDSPRDEAVIQPRPDTRLLRGTHSQSSTSDFHVNVHTHPKTTFSCAGKQAGEYYADVEAKCAIYYVCIGGANGALVPISFACPNGTLFNQANRVCAQEEMVFCGLATRWYDAVRGVIDSKGKDPKEVTTNNFPLGSQTAWNHGAQEGPSSVSRYSSFEQRQPAGTVPKVVTTSNVQNDVVRNVPVRPPPPQWLQGGVTRAQTSSSVPAQTPQASRIVPPVSKPLTVRSRQQGNNPLSTRAQVSLSTSNPLSSRAQVSLSTSRPTARPTTTTTQGPKLSNDYEYIDYESAPPSATLKESVSNTGEERFQSERTESSGAESGIVSEAESGIVSEAGRGSRAKRSPKRKKGKLLGFPSDFLTKPTGNVTSESKSNFTCNDKVSTLSYADIASNCTKFHICLEVKKGKMSDNILYCQPGHGFSQEAAACLPLGSFHCENSEKYFVLDKSKTGQGKTWKLPIAWTKKSLFPRE